MKRTKLLHEMTNVGALFFVVSYGSNLIYNFSPILASIMTIIGICLAVAGVIYNTYWDARLSWEQKAKPVTSATQTRDLPPLAKELLNLILSERERDNIVGDLSEAYLEFNSKIKADLWLYKQILKSVVPLLYNTFRHRLASYFRERIR